MGGSRDAVYLRSAMSEKRGKLSRCGCQNIAIATSGWTIQSRLISNRKTMKKTKMERRDYTKLLPDDDGWCAWQSPIHGNGKRNYRLACCDCQLVHEMQFRIKKRRNGRLDVVFRASRNNRATSALRRGSNPKKKRLVDNSSQ